MNFAGLVPPTPVSLFVIKSVWGGGILAPPRFHLDLLREVESSTEVRGGRVTRLISRCPVNPRRPPSLYRAYVRPWFWGAESRRASAITTSLPASSSAGTAVLASAGPLVVLFLRDDGLAEEDHRPPGPFVSDPCVNDRRK